MTGHERMQAAFSAAGTPEIPAVICYEGIYYRDHFAELTDQPWWALQSGEMNRHLAVHADRLARTGQDWLSLPLGLSHDERRRRRIEERADGVYRIEVASGSETRLRPPQVSGAFIDRDRNRPSPTTPDEIDALLPMPDPDDLERPFTDGRTELPMALLASAAAGLMPYQSVASPLWGCSWLWPFEEGMTLALESPDLLEHACGRHVDRTLERLPYLARLGVRAVWIEECWLDMISPDHYARLHLPHLRRLTSGVRAAGMFSVFYYCGNPNDRLPLLLDAGADALSLEESKKGFRIDIAELAEAVDGRVALLGNLDAIALLEHGSEAGLRAEIGRQLQAGRRNRSRFIMSLGSPVTPGTSPARVRLYCDLVHELGQS